MRRHEEYVRERMLRGKVVRTCHRRREGYVRERMIRGKVVRTCHEKA